MQDRRYTVFYIMLAAYIAASFFYLVLWQLATEIRMSLAADTAAAVSTMWATWVSALVILLTAAVALFAIFSGNQEKRKDRAVALFRLVQSDDHRALYRTLEPFSDLDDNRSFLVASWNESKVWYTATHGGPTTPLDKAKVTREVVALTNVYDEMYLHLKYKLVDEAVLLDSVSLLLLYFYYSVQPILAGIEDQLHLSFSNLRCFARRAQEWARENETGVDPRLLVLDTSDRRLRVSYGK